MISGRESWLEEEESLTDGRARRRWREMTRMERVMKGCKDQPLGLRGAGLTLILTQETYTEEPPFL